MPVACLVGNGLSVAYNTELCIDRITAALMSRLTKAPDSAEAAQDSWEQSVKSLNGRAPSKGVFEELLGPLERLPEALRSLEELASLVPAVKIDGGEVSLAEAQVALRKLYRHGVGHTLAVIDSRARAEGDLAREVVLNFVKRVMEMGSKPGDVSFGTLNYDSLLNGAVIEATENQCCDLADPRNPSPKVDLGGGLVLDGIALREGDDLLDDRTRVYNLHGSLAWWGPTGGFGDVVKLTLSELRDQRVLERWRSGELNWNPVVLLTDQKGKRAAQYPFSLAYRGFEQRLRNAHKWVIVGYSFGDEPVNEMLARACVAQQPNVLVIAKPDDPHAFMERAGEYLPKAMLEWELDGVQQTIPGAMAD